MTGECAAQCAGAQSHMQDGILAQRRLGVGDGLLIATGEDVGESSRALHSRHRRIEGADTLEIGHVPDRRL